MTKLELGTDELKTAIKNKIRELATAVIDRDLDTFLGLDTLSQIIGLRVIAQLGGDEEAEQGLKKMQDAWARSN